MSHKKHRTLQVTAKWKEYMKQLGGYVTKGQERQEWRRARKTKEGEVKAKWQEHFMEVLNRPVPEVATEVEEADVVNNSIDIGEIGRSGVHWDMKSGEAPGIDIITADLLRVDTDTAVNALHELFNKIWVEKNVP